MGEKLQILTKLQPKIVSGREHLGLTAWMTDGNIKLDLKKKRE
jgi:hypothetical protein